MPLLCLAALIVPASAQHFKQVTGFTGSMVEVAGFLTVIATCGGGVWGINSSSELFAFNFSNQTFQDTTFSGPIFLAADVYGVWAIGTNGAIAWVGAFGGAYGEGIIPGSLAQIAAGGDGVWGINSSQSIFRLDPASGNFVNVPGFLTQIAVGSGAGVWGVSPNSGEVFAFVRP